MDPVIALVIVSVVANATLLAVLYYVYKFLRRTLVYIKASDVHQAEAVEPMSERELEENEVIETPTGLTDRLKKKQKEAYNNLPE